MPNTLNPRLGVSTWSLNKLITGGTPLLDIPAQVAAHGLGKLELCHFHLPSTEDAYLEKFRAALDSAGVELYTLLIDEGDLTDPDTNESEKALEMMTDWTRIASKCGAVRVRVIAGNAVASEETLSLSAAGLEVLWHRANYLGVRVVTENWHRLLDQPHSVRRLLDMTQERLADHGQIGLKLDFGNWPAPLKYDDLPQIADLAECTHAKAHFTAPGQMDRDDFKRCLDICAEANFAGPHILIFSDPGDEWESLDQMRDVAASYVGTDA